jgi:hypothetical protein
MKAAIALTWTLVALTLLPAPAQAAPKPPPGVEDSIPRPRPVVPGPTLSVLTANLANATTLGGVEWRTRVDRFTAGIAASGPAPDLISLTEIAGWWNCSVHPYYTARHYDMLDRLIANLRESTGATYRVAYMVGAPGSVRNRFGTPFCWYHSGDAVLYNPARLANLTPGDVAQWPQVGHDSGLLGFQVRRSLPLCDRGTNLEPLDRLIDGPPQVDACNVPTPSGPAWVQVDASADGREHGVVASLGRFSHTAVPGSSFDVVTVHPTSGEEELHREPINAFVAGTTGPGFRAASPTWPPVVLGDFNMLADGSWPRQTAQAYKDARDVMAVHTGAGVGLPAAGPLTVTSTASLPATGDCSTPLTPGGFSDHCALLVRFAL